MFRKRLRISYQPRDCRQQKDSAPWSWLVLEAGKGLQRCYQHVVHKLCVYNLTHNGDEIQDIKIYSKVSVWALAVTRKTKEVEEGGFMWDACSHFYDRLLML